MFEKIKKVAIYVLYGVVICVAGGVAGYILRWNQSRTIEVGTNGTILERTNIMYKPVIIYDDSPCSDIERRYNVVLADLTTFLKANPEVYDVSESHIRFKLHTQKYQLTYKYTPQPAWGVTPFVFARGAIQPLALYYGGGCVVEYSGFSGIIAVDNNPALTIGAGYKFTIGLQ